MSDVGMCDIHDRMNEGLCKNCETLVCASCVLFGKHKKHDIISLKDAELFLREQIDKYMKLDFLRKEFSETSILEIKEHSLNLEKYKNETVKKIDEIFKKIINVLKERKAILIKEILERFSEEKEKIIFEESRWIEKQEISERLISLLNEGNSISILINSKYIMEGLRTLKEKLEFKQLKVFNDLDYTLNFVKEIDRQDTTISLSIDEIMSSFSEYLNINNPKVLEYKA